MARFLGRLQLAQVVDASHRPVPTSDGRSTWNLLENLAFETDDGEMITAPKGMRTDLGSVPQIAWSLGYPPDGIGAPAYVIHDLLCLLARASYLGPFLAITRERPYDSLEAAGVLKQALAVCGVPTGHRERIYEAVVLGGPQF